MDIRNEQMQMFPQRFIRKLFDIREQMRIGLPMHSAVADADADTPH